MEPYKNKPCYFRFPGTGEGEVSGYLEFFDKDNMLMLADPMGDRLEGEHLKPHIPAAKRASKKGYYDYLYEGLFEIKLHKIIEGMAKIVPEAISGELGTIYGSGDFTNTQRVLEFLQSKEDADDLPKEIVLDGYSRGGITTIMAANEIYKKYGDKIKIHMFLIDPVPGPFHEEQWEKRVIPPNVASFTSFYTSDDKMGIFFTPHSLDKLVFINKETIISSYAINNVYHGVMGDKICCPYIEFAKDEILAGITGKENLYTYESVKDQVEKIEKTEKNLRTGIKKLQKLPKNSENIKKMAKVQYAKEIYKPLKNQMFENIEDMQDPQERNYLRKNLDFFAETKLEGHPRKNSDLVKKIKGIRRLFRYGSMEDADIEEPRYIDPDESIIKKLHYEEIELPANASSEAREKALRLAHRNVFKTTLTLDQFIATALILPTLGFSANLYQSSQIIDSRLRALYFIAGVLTLNTFPVVQKVATDAVLIIYNMIKSPMAGLEEKIHPEEKLRIS